MTLHDAMVRRRARAHHRRRRRRARQRLPHHQGLSRRVRAEARHRHAARRSVDRRHRGRHGDGRVAADRRDPVRRLHLSGVQPDRRRSGQDALPLQRRLHVSAGDPHALRRRRARRALALGLDRSAVLSRARPEDRRAVDAARHQRAADRGDRGSRSGAVPRTQENVPLGQGRGARRATSRSRSAKPTSRKPARKRRSFRTATTCIKRSTRPRSSKPKASRSR